jgi:N-acetylglucosamine kinase-like BadF-type ATPase
MRPLYIKKRRLFRAGGRGHIVAHDVSGELIVRMMPGERLREEDQRRGCKNTLRSGEKKHHRAEIVV